jgi:hypothetical protein
MRIVMVVEGTTLSIEKSETMGPTTVTVATPEQETRVLRAHG